MKRNAKSLVILAVVFALILLVYFGIVLGKNFASEKKQAESAVPVGNLVDVVDLAYNTGESSLHFTSSDSIWQYADDLDFPLDAYRIRQLNNYLVGLKASRQIEISDSLAAYGLENPSRTLRAVDSGGNVLELYFGIPSGDGTLYYAMIPGGDCIYTISAEIYEYLGNELYDMVKLESIPAPDKEDVEYVEFSSGDTTLKFIQRAETTGDKVGYNWYLEKNGKETLADDLVPTPLTGEQDPNGEYTGYTASDYLADLRNSTLYCSFYRCVDYNADSAALTEYGFDSPSLVMTVQYRDADTAGSATYSITFGAPVYDDSGAIIGYYARLSDSTAVNIMDTRYAPRFFNMVYAFAEA